MLVILEIMSGPQSGDQIPIGPGQTVSVGRTHSADLVFPDDARMSGVHFVLSCKEDSCLLVDQNSRNGTFVNGRQVVEVIVNNGDQIAAGDTTFAVHVDLMASAQEAQTRQRVAAGTGRPITDTAVGDEGGPTVDSVAVIPVGPEPTAREVCEHFELGEAAKPLLKDDLTPEQFLEVLVKHELYPDAIKLWAHTLPKKEAVWWGIVCSKKAYGDQASPKEAEALAAAEKWIKKPTEEHRRAAMSAAEAAQLNNAASWSAVSCFWSEGSLAPSNVPAVPPDEHLAAKAVAGAVMLAATIGPPNKMPQRYQSFFDLGKQVASGKNRWEEQK
jgi:pSer/pThr/pTyr-binding forkhead associated (FHA) protein